MRAIVDQPLARPAEPRGESRGLVKVVFDSLFHIPLSCVHFVTFVLVPFVTSPVSSMRTSISPTARAVVVPTLHR